MARLLAAGFQMTACPDDLVRRDGAKHAGRIAAAGIVVQGMVLSDSGLSLPNEIAHSPGMVLGVPA